MNLEIVNDEIPQKADAQELWEQLCEEHGEERMEEWARAMAELSATMAVVGVSTAEAAAALHSLMIKVGDGEDLDGGGVDGPVAPESQGDMKAVDNI